MLARHAPAGRHFPAMSAKLDSCCNASAKRVQIALLQIYVLEGVKLPPFCRALLQIVPQTTLHTKNALVYLSYNSSYQSH